jgi:hypothetical protein
LGCKPQFPFSANFNTPDLPHLVHVVVHKELSRSGGWYGSPPPEGNNSNSILTAHITDSS